MYSLIEGLDPSYVIQIGDLFDCYSQSSFAKSMVMTPEDEFIQARIEAEIFWDRIQTICPNARCYQLLGNHEMRLKKKIRSMLPEMEHMFNVNKIFDFCNVHTVYDEREPLIIRGINFVHGWKCGLNNGSHAKYINGPIVVGHTHTGGVWFGGSNNLWELNVGYLADESSYALGYTPLKKYTNWTHGFGIIDDMGPRFIRL